jgi:pilus assembly protein CpaC
MQKTVVTMGLTAALIVILVAPAMSQVRPVAARATGAVAAESAETVDLLVGRSAVIRTDRPIKRVALPKPEIADALVTSPHEVLVQGKTPGTIALLVWGDTGRISTYNIVVQRDLTLLEERIEQLFPGEEITVSSNGADVVLSGIVSSSYVVDKAASLALGYVEKKENVVNLLRQDEGLASNQVLLRVRFAEVSRTAMQELGASYFTGPNGYKDWIGRGTTQQFAAPGFNDQSRPNQLQGLVFSDFLNLIAFNSQEQLGLAVRALQQKGLFQSLAEPNLVTQNGKEASFLAGGEYPYPVVQGAGAAQSVTIMFKEFGVRLRFTPTITGNDTIHLKVAPEVSALDFANAVTAAGFRVPAISSRRTETEVELRDGQTFAIAGLIDNSVTQTMSKIPGIGDIPILGLLFRSRAYQKNATELVVMITPQILRRDSVGVTGDLPRLVTPFIQQEKKSIPPPAPAFSSPGARSVAPVGDDAASAEDAINGNEHQQPAPAANVPAPAAPVAAPAGPTRSELKALEKARAEAAERERLAREAEAERMAREREAEEKAAAVEAEQARKKAEEDRRQAVIDQKNALKQAEIDRKQAAKQAEIDRKNAEKQAELERRLAREQEALERKQAEIDRKRLAEEEKRNAKIRQEEAKLERERAKRAAEEAEREKQIEQMREEAEKKKAEERRQEQERLMKERAKREPWPRLRSRL